MTSSIVAGSWQITADNLTSELPQ